MRSKFDLRAQFDTEGLTGLDVDQLAVADLVAGFLEQPRRLDQVGAHLFRAADSRIGVGRVVNTSGGTSARTVVEDFELRALRQADEASSLSFEIARDTMILAVEQLFCSSVEVEGEIEGAAQPGVGEFGAHGIEDERLA